MARVAGIDGQDFKLPFQAVYMQTHLNAAWDAANASTPTEAAAPSRG